MGRRVHIVCDETKDGKYAPIKAFSSEEGAFEYMEKWKGLGLQTLSLKSLPIEVVKIEKKKVENINTVG
jgi:hypothetical protein